MVQEKKSDKELSVDRLIQKVEMVAKNCNSFTYDIRLCDIQGNELHRIKDANKGIEKQDKIDLLKDSIKEAMDIYPNCYSVVGVVGPTTNKSSRTTVREVVNPDLIRPKSDDDDDDTMPMPPAVPSGQVISNKQQPNVMNTDYSEMTNDFFNYIGGLFGASLNGADGAKTDPKTSFALAVQQFKIKTDMQIEQLNGIVDTNKVTIAELNAKIELYKKQIDKLENDLRKQKDKADRQQKHIDSLRPKLEEAERLSTKTGQIAQIGSGLLTGVAMNLLANSQFAGMMGLTPGVPPQAQQQQQSPQEPQYQAEPVEDGEDEPEVEQVEE